MTTHTPARVILAERVIDCDTGYIVGVSAWIPGDLSAILDFEQGILRPFDYKESRYWDDETRVFRVQVSPEKARTIRAASFNLAEQGRHPLFVDLARAITDAIGV